YLGSSFSFVLRHPPGSPLFPYTDALPISGGGAIPLEAARLGCRSYGNDINPVAHIIQKGSLEFPQKYGKPISYSKTEFIKLYGQDRKSTRLNSSHVKISYAVFCLKKKKRK